MAVALPVAKRLDGMWWNAFTEMVVAEIKHLRDSEKRARVEAAGKLAHEQAAKAYCAVYKEVFDAAMNA